MIIGFLAVLSPWGSPAFAAGHHPVNLSLFYPLSTNQDPEISTNFRLSLFYGRVGEVRGIDLNGIVSSTGGEMRGVQLNGAVAHLGGGFHGVQATGLFNYVVGESRGLQIAGLVNYQRAFFHGIQYTNLFNFTEKGYRGAQIATVFNLNDGDGGILQLSGAANLSSGNFQGVQISLFFNYANQRMDGLQLGFTNLAYETEGVQVGAINVARDLKGLQLGIVNQSREIDGIPLGLVNLSKVDSRADALLFVDDKALLNLGVRTVVHRWYSIFSVGFWDQVEQRKDTVFLRWNYGYDFPLGKQWFLGTDLGFVHIIPQPSDNPEENGSLHFALQARAMAERRGADGGAFFGGLGIQTQWDNYSLNAPTVTTGLLFAGVAIF